VIAENATVIIVSERIIRLVICVDWRAGRVEIMLCGSEGK
jgi:hypothetical protein